MTLSELHQCFAEYDIHLIIIKKQVKNINFRMKLGECRVSAPCFASEKSIIAAVGERLSWAVAVNQKLQQREAKPERQFKTLWGVARDLPDDERAVLAIYRDELTKKLPNLMTKWQPIVGRFANEVRLRAMTTRWGTCNTRDKRVWLSVYLAAYPYECAEYVFVHELCHLIHANHSADFWHEVKKAMPNYQKWHDLLKGKIDT